MKTNPPSPFGLDPDVQDIGLPGDAATTEDPFGFSDQKIFDPFDATLTPASHRPRSFPWSVVAAAVGAVLLIAALAVGINWLLTQGIIETESPQQVVEKYYDALQRADFETLDTCLDPEDVAHDNILPYGERVLQGLNDFAKNTLGLNIKVRWEFQDLAFSTVSKTNETAQVDVAGKLRVWEETTNLGPTVRYQHTHEMVKRKGHWYLRP